MMSIKIKTISMVRIPPPKCRKYLFHVTFTRRSKVSFASAFCIKKTTRLACGFLDTKKESERELRPDSVCVSHIKKDILTVLDVGLELS